MGIKWIAEESDVTQISDSVSFKVIFEIKNPEFFNQNHLQRNHWTSTIEVTLQRTSWNKYRVKLQLLLLHWFFNKNWEKFNFELFWRSYFERNERTPDWWNANFRGFYFRTKFGGFNPYEPMLNMITSHRMSTNFRIWTMEIKGYLVARPYHPLIWTLSWTTCPMDNFGRGRFTLRAMSCVTI